MTRESALDRLSERRSFGIRLGLAAEVALLEKLGNPHTAYGCIHVAGTNGKGSVCAMLDAVLRAAGGTIGLYTSPHLVEFHERFRVNGDCIDDADLVTAVRRIEALADQVEAEREQAPTFFECSTAIAFDDFRRRGVRLAVLETGLGGRLDATNVVTPLVSVITRIGLDHTQYLGDTIEAIAAEKGGIVKPGRPVVCGTGVPAAEQVIAGLGRERGSTVCHVAENVSVRVLDEDLCGQKVSLETVGKGTYGTMRLPLSGSHQVENLATAVMALEVLADVLGTPFDPAVIKAGIESVRWPGRTQVLQAAPPRILDGAHNPGAAEVLAAWLKRVFKGRPLGLVLGMCGDKDMVEFLKPFAGLVDRVWAVPLRSDRGLDPGLIAWQADRMGWSATTTTLDTALPESRAWAEQAGGAVCITGSLYLVGEMLEREEDE